MQRLPATRQRVLKPFLHLPSSAAQMPPLCKGRWRGLPRRRDCFFFTSLQPTIPHPTSSGAPFAQGSLFIKTSCDFPFFAFSSSAKPLLNHAKGVMRPIAWFSFYSKTGRCAHLPVFIENQRPQKHLRPLVFGGRRSIRALTTSYRHPKDQGWDQASSRGRNLHRPNRG